MGWRLVVLAGACALLVAGCGGSGKKHPAALTPEQLCAQTDMPITGNRNEAPPLQPKLDPSKTYLVTIQTSCGNFTIKVNPTFSPHAAASFVNLVKELYYDATIFHRVWVGTLIQGGDPTGSGTGGPGYSTVDKVPSTTQYTRGIVAMAKTGADPPGTAGGQFFIVTSKNAGLDPDYAVIGKVVKGLPTVEAIGQMGNPDQSPLRVLELINASLSVS
jgi:cyclophilin family peptidyl-prolyl cis-trans isomerase